MYTTVEPRLSVPRLSGLFLQSQFWHEYLLVMIKIRSNILLKTIALNSAVKSKFVLLLKAALACAVTNEEHSNEF